MDRREDEGASDFFNVLDYVLNKASPKEIDAFSAAIVRRQNQYEDHHNRFHINPVETAKKMSKAVYTSINTSMNGVRTTFRNYAAELLQNEAPELSQEQLETLIDSWIAPACGITGRSSACLAKAGKVQGIPADALYEMIVQFVSYSLGEMSIETQRELALAMHNWTSSYWQRFPYDIRREIKSFLHGEITSGVFQRNIRGLLGLA